MNKEIEEFDKKQLEELLKRLKDINNFTGFKDGAFKYYLGKYEADLLLSYIEQLEQLENNKEKEYVLVGRMQLKTRDYIHQLEKEKRQLKNNRDKAIEYVEWQRDNPQYDNVWRKHECESLINILKGGSDD